MENLWTRISNTGIHSELPFSERSRVRILNQISFIASLFALLYFIYDLLFINERKTPEQQLSFYILTIAFLVNSSIVLLLNKNGFHVAARFVCILIASVVLIINSVTLAQPFRSELYFFGSAAFVFIVFNKMRVIIPVFLLQVVGYLLAAYIIIQRNPEVTNVNSGLFIRIFIAFSVLFLILYFLRQETNLYQEEIEIKNIQVSEDHDEIQKINFTKDKIFSIISHDLRSPIGSLQALLGMLNREQLSEQEFKKASAGLQKQVDQLKDSLDELLTWSKAQLHGINPEPEVVPLKTLIYEVVTVNRPTARNKKIIITTNIPSEITAFCDPNMLRSVITNLITNAIKFTPVGGAISISCKNENATAKIAVEDTGLGIPKENLVKILSPTIHFTTRGTNNEKGTGLGLIMCREFIQKNNGSFEVESEDGKGSIFLLTLPSQQRAVS